MKANTRFWSKFHEVIDPHRKKKLFTQSYINQHSQCHYWEKVKGIASSRGIP
jgi:hypothetical protein